ncbi:MAG: hypothetical protein DI534_06850 [Leifsonia xyli]|nr:MAG: hypothetical protein DI534_06850 [Leifsonia xyli]
MTDDVSTSQTAAPGWYPDGSGGQRWWDGRDWTEHRAPAPASASAPAIGAPPERTALPAGTRIDSGWVWVVSLLNVVISLPWFFFDIGGYMRSYLEAMLSGNAGVITNTFAGYFGVIAIFGLLGWAAFGFLVFSAFRDYKHLLAIGVVRPFHWAFAFIPYPIVYLIGRQVVLRKVSRTVGWPLWAHIVAYTLLYIGLSVWILVAVQSALSTLAGYYGVYS